jgi:hypothetical protein
MAVGISPPVLVYTLLKFRVEVRGGLGVRVRRLG